MERIDQDRETRLLASKSGQQDAAAALAHQRREGSGVTAARAVVLEQQSLRQGSKPSVHRTNGVARLKKAGALKTCGFSDIPGACRSARRTHDWRALPLD